MKIAILGANPNCGNRGVNALAYSIIEILNEVLKDKTKEIYFIESFSGTEKFINLNGKKSKIYLYPIIYPRPNKSWLYLFKKDVLKLQFCKWDAVLVINGGDSFSDIYGQPLLQKLIRDVKTLRKRTKKLVFLPQTIGPFKLDSSKQMAQDCLNKADFIFSRDYTSFQLLEKFHLNKIQELIDMAFFLPYKKIHFDENYCHVGINVSSLLWNGGYSGNNQFELKCNYQQAIYNIIEKLLEDEKIIIHLVPHVFSDNWYEVENDYAISKILTSHYDNKRVTLSPYFFDPCEAKSYISGMNFFVGARMHACIAAFSSGVPTVPMAYSRKFTGLFTETLGYNCLCDMREQDEDLICENVLSFCKDRNHLKKIAKQINETIVVERKNQLLNSLNTIFYDN